MSTGQSRGGRGDRGGRGGRRGRSRSRSRDRDRSRSRSRDRGRRRRSPSYNRSKSRSRSRYDQLSSKDIFHGKLINAQTLIHVGPDRRRGGGARALARGRINTVGGYAGCCMHSVADVKGGKLARTKAKAKTLIQYQAHAIGVG